MNYETISNLKFRPLLEISSISIHINLSGEKRPVVSVSVTRLVLIWEKTARFISNKKYATNDCFKISRDSFP